MPSSDTISLYRGEDVTLTFTMDPTANITGWTITFAVRSSEGIEITKTANVTDGPGGVFTVTLADTDTDALRTGTYHYDAWRVDAGSERVLAVGSFVILAPARSTV
jgi:hypothetical protein